MTLRGKAWLIAGGAIAGVIVALLLATSSIVVGGFDTAERRVAREGAARSAAAIEMQLGDLDATTRDWASWDATYRYAVSGGEAFERSNLIPETFQTLDLDALVITNLHGEVVYQMGYAEGAVGPPPSDLVPLVGELPSRGSGVEAVDGRPMLLAIRPILTSSDRGPARGTFVMGRFLDEDRLAQLSRVTGSGLEADVLGRGVARELPGGRGPFGATGVRVRSVDAETIAGYAPLIGVDGRTTAVVRALRDRHVSATGDASRWALIVALGIAMLVLAATGIFAMERVVLRRIRGLARDVRRIGSDGEADKVATEGRDEIATLGSDINQMLESLAEAERARASSEAGFRAIVEDASDGIILVDPSTMRVVSANRAYAAMLGEEPPWLEGRSFYDLVDADPGSVDRNIERVRADGRAFIGERRHRRLDGSTIDVEVTAAVVVVEGREMVSAVIRDLEPQRAMREALRRREAILEAVAFAAEGLLREGTDALDEVLRRLGEAAQASRVYVFRATAGEDETYVTQIREWSDAGIASQAENPDLREMPMRAAGFARWERVFARGGVVKGRVASFPESERAILEEQGIISLAVVPIFGGGRLWGFVGFDDCVREREWSQAEVGSLRAAASTLGAAFERERDEEERLRRTQYLEALHETSLALLNRLDPGELLEAIVGRAAQLLEAEHGWVYLADPDGERLRLEIGTGSFGRYVGTELERGEGLSGLVWERGEPMVIEDYRRWKGRVDAFDEEITGIVGMPLVSAGEVIGVMGLVRIGEDRSFDASEVALLSRFVELASIALDNARLYHAAMEEQARSRQLADSALEGICIHEDGVIVEANRAFLEMFGYEADEIVGRSLLEVVPPETMELARERMATYTDEPAEATVWRKDRTRFQVEVIMRTMNYRGREARVAAVRDITERKRAEERYRSLFEEAAEGIYRVDREGRFEAANPALARILGYETPDGLRAAVPAMDAAAVDPERPRACRAGAESQGSMRECEYEVRRRDGQVIWVSENLRAVRDDADQVVGFEGTVLDITQRKLAEESLRVAYERERQAADRLRGLDEMKTSFMTAVSHELRTPLASILGFALTLDRRDIELPQEQTREMIERIAVNARKLERLLSDLLDLDRISRGILEPSRRETDMGGLVRRVVEEADIGDRPLLVEVEEVTASVDGPKVERILENLLANAVKYTPEGTPVWVRILADATSVELVVEDAGPGVPEPLRDAIFEPFRQGKGAPSHAPGTGIGLSLVARFAELHGGRAWVEEREGGGASFHVHLPGSPGAASRSRVLAGRTA